MKDHRMLWSSVCSRALNLVCRFLSRVAMIHASIASGRRSLQPLIAVFGFLLGITAVGAYAQPCTSPPPGMVAWYTGDDCGPGDLLALHDGAFVGFPVCSLNWQVGGGAMAFFPAPATYVTVPSAADLNFGAGDFSIDMWIRTTSPTGVPGVVPILDKRAANPVIGYHLALFNGYLLVQLADGAGSGSTNYFSTSDANLFVSDGQWHYIAVTVDRDHAQGLVLHVDGHSRSFNPTGRQGSLTNTASLLIGARHAGLGGGTFDGQIDELEIFDRALSASEIQDIYQAGAAGKCKACVPMPPVCSDPILNADPRPLWQDLALPQGSGYPDYVNVTQNLQLMKTIRLLASIVTRAAQKLQDLSSQVDDNEAVGRCVCSLTEIHQDVKREDCDATSQNLPCTNSPSGTYPLWLPTDLFKDTHDTARFALEFIGFLDKIKELLEKIQNNPNTSALAAALTQLGTGLDNLADLLNKYADYVDLLTEGYHLGGYSTERPDLHLCVGYGGHGAYAEMANLFGGEVSIGARYTSHNLSKEHRAQFRSGGFAVTAFGRALSILPGMEANLQIDGFKLWDANKPFGIDMPVVGDCSCADGCGFPLSDIDKYDIFHLLDSSATDPCDSSNPTQLSCFDSTPGDACLQPGEFIIKDFYPATYLQTLQWPRPPFADCDWETESTAVFGAGINLELRLKRIEKEIPPGGIILFPGATLFVKFTLDAGADWKHEANELRDRLKDAINKPLPTSLQLTADDFERPMHDLQAQDVSADDMSSVFVRPRLAGDLLFGINLNKYLKLGITVAIGVSVRVEPAAHGGVYDFNVALADALLNSNPPVSLPCDPIIKAEEKKRCSNTLHVDPDTGDALSSGDYSCETTQVVTYHCKEPEQKKTCEPASAEKDCPKTHECVAEYGCAAFGFCTRVLDAGKDGEEGTDDDVVHVAHDTTYAACIGEAVCDEPAVNAGAACDTNDDCPAPRQCAGGDHAGQACTTNANCTRGTCSTPHAPCVTLSPTGYFTPYQCLVSAIPEITGWQGPGCHPFTVGYSSACGCQTTADCVAGQETCTDGACHSVSNNQAVPCDCDPGNSLCTAGRVCVEGGCLRSCVVDANCAAHQVCGNGGCENAYGIPFAEQVVWQVTNAPKPQHAVGTYAVSEILATSLLDVGMWIGLDLKIFKKLYHFDIFDFTKYWPIGTPTNKIWFQAGLEARYQNDCDPALGATVSNWQPGGQRVTRYNPLQAGSGSYGNAGTEADLLHWCDGALPLDVANPNSPGEGDLVGAVTDLVNFGEDIGLDIWSLTGVCVSTRVDGVLTEQTFSEWLSGFDPANTNLTCRYVYNNHIYVFPCSELGERLLLIWGCLDVNANPHAMILATHFNGISDPLDIVTTFDGRQVLDLDLMQLDPTAQFELDNLKPQIRNYGLFQGVLWYAAASACWDSHYAQVQPGDVELVGVDVHPCCGNGVLDVSGCGQAGGAPCEECDDGDVLPGDGCSPLCRIEGRVIPIGCGDGAVQAGLGEQCDRNDDAACPARCKPDCTCPRFVHGDIDFDGDLDLDDFSGLRDCLSGPANPYGDSPCASFDRNSDHRVDLLDFRAFQGCFSGSGVPASVSCEN